MTRLLLLIPDSPTQVSRVVVAIETLDVNDNAPELDRQYTTALCDSAAVGQVSKYRRLVPCFLFRVHSFVCACMLAVHLFTSYATSAPRGYCLLALQEPYIYLNIFPEMGNTN